MNKVVHDLKFSQAGIKRWIVKYAFNRYSAGNARPAFTLKGGRGQEANMVDNYSLTAFIKL